MTWANFLRYSALQVALYLVQYRPAHEKNPHKKLRGNFRGREKVWSGYTEIRVEHSLSLSKKSGLSHASICGFLWGGRYRTMVAHFPREGCVDVWVADPPGWWYQGQQDECMKTISVHSRSEHGDLIETYLVRLNFHFCVQVYLIKSSPNTKMLFSVFDI